MSLSKIKVGIDIHGVLDASEGITNFFKSLTFALTRSGNEVHVITGHEDNQILRERLGKLGIKWTNLFSITSYHKKIGTIVKYKSDNNPFMDKDLWDKTKAEYCSKNNINLMIDDSATYGKHFTTPYALFFSGIKKEKKGLFGKTKIKKKKK